MNELIYLKNNEAVCSSLDVAEKFHKSHKNVLRNIDNLLKNEGVKNMFFKGQYHDEKNEKRPMYYMNRDGFSLLVMGFTGKKALEWKLQYIKAFNNMEAFIREKTSEAWIETRKAGKITRQSETDVIKQLVEYAKQQGSENSQMLYVTYSKLANKVAGITKRELATVAQLNNLTLIENIILNQIRVGMQREMNYKDIYKDCKRQLEIFKSVAYLETAV